MAWKFKRPKNGHFWEYCGTCEHFQFREQVGCAALGICTAIKDEPIEQDAFDSPCGLWKEIQKK